MEKGFRCAGAFLDLLFPPKCPFCQRVLDRPGVCGDCLERLPWTGGRDSLRDLGEGLLCAAPLWYQDSVRDALRALKFQGRVTAAAPLGALIARCAAEQFPGGFDAVTWAPVSRKRRRKRGYDQGRLLAESVCRTWGMEPARLLEKTRDNRAQSGLADAGARWENVEGVYRAVGGLSGRRVLLVDDICTTGATLSACAQALYSAGADKVFCAAAARTPQKAENEDLRKD